MKVRNRRATGGVVCNSPLPADPGHTPELGCRAVRGRVPMDYLSRGLVIRRLEIDVAFRSLLVFRPGKPLSQKARDLLSQMRIQAQHDLTKIEAALR